MCGIAGFTGKKNPEIIKNIQKSLDHRGPDSKGHASFLEDQLQFVHARLSIIDVSDSGHQPFISHDNRWAITYNGEIYNFKELRNALAIPFKSSSDTEVLIESIAMLGLEKTLSSIRGMFAFGVVDLVNRKLYLVRDRAGEKPLYYYHSEDKFAFASELKALEEIPYFKPDINLDSVELYFRNGYIPQSHSIYKNTHKLRPGHYLTLDLVTGKSEVQRYWQNEILQNPTIKIPYAEAIAELREKLNKTVEIQMISDVPIGAFLSGGIDSSLVVAMMKQHSNQVKTFSIGFDDQKLNEAPYAKKVAEYLKTDHHELIVDGRTALETIPIITKFYDEPFSDFSQIPTYLVSKFARSQVTVALSGDGGDEVFGGYNRYRDYPMMLKAVRSLGLLITTGTSLPGMKDIIKRKLGPYKAEKLFYTLNSKSHSETYSRLRELWGNRFPITKMPKKSFCQEWRSSQLAEEMMAIDFETYLPDDILVKVDRASMACSLETRAPLLDHTIIEFASSLPHDFRIRGNSGKVILKDLLHEFIPRELFDRPKAGFMPPVRSWLRKELRDWADELLSPSKLPGYIDANIVQKTWKEHLDSESDWTQQIWSLLMFMTWLERGSKK